MPNFIQFTDAQAANVLALYFVGLVAFVWVVALFGERRVNAIGRDFGPVASMKVVPHRPRGAAVCPSCQGGGRLLMDPAHPQVGSWPCAPCGGTGKVQAR